MDIIKKIDKFLATTLVLTSLFSQLDKSFVYAMKPEKLSIGNIKKENIEEIKRYFENSVGSSELFYDTESGKSCPYFGEFQVGDRKKVSCMVFNAPALMDNLVVNKFNEKIVKDEKDSFMSHVKKQSSRYNIFQILGCIYADSIEICDTIDEEYSQYKKESIKKMDKLFEEKLSQDDYKEFIETARDYFGDIVDEEKMKSAIKAFMYFTSLIRSSKAKAVSGQIIFWISEVATFACPLLLPITWFTSQKGAEMIADSEIEHIRNIENERAENVGNVLKDFVNIICNESERVADSNSLFILIDTREDITTFDKNVDGWFSGMIEGMKKLFVPSIYTYESNAGYDVQFMGVRGLKNAPKMVEYKRNQKNVFDMYVEIFRQLSLAGCDRTTLHIAGNKLRGIEYPQRPIKEEKKDKK